MYGKYWGYLIHLGENMWGDPWSRIRWAKYYPELSLDEDVWKNTIDFLPSQGINMVLIDVGDGIEYERHPEISVKGAWSKDKLKAELDRIRSLGMTPFPKLNFSAGHDAWLGKYAHMLSTPKYYEVCKDCIEEVAELFDYPKYFHLGLDEEDTTNQGGQGMMIVRQMELYWHDVYKILGYCEATGCTPWVWATYAWTEGHLEEYLRRMPKDVLQSSGWYNRFKKNPDGTYTHSAIETYLALDRHGYKQILCSSCIEGYSKASYETMEMAKNEMNDENILGFMTAPWRLCHYGDRYALMDDAFRFGLAKKEWYPKG